MLKEFLEDQNAKNKLKKSLYKLIHKKGITSKIDFLNEINVPQTTLTRMVSELEERGLIRSRGYGESSGGRPPVLYEVVPDTGYVIGIEISRTHVSITLLNIMFDVLGQIRFTLTKDHTPKITIEKIIHKINALLEEHSIKIDLLLGIGVGAVGPLDREKGIILNPEGFLADGWENVQIVSMLQSEFSVPIFLNNGANTAALAEYEIQGLEEEDILYCISGFGIRCGFISKGAFLNLREGDTSSYGHIIIEPNGRKCICGRKGCLNAYVSFDAIFKAIEETNISPPLKINMIDELLGLLNNDYILKKLLESAYYYGIAIANMVNILHPTTVVLHGKLIYQSNEYYNEVIRVAKEHIYSTKRNQIMIKKGSLGEDSTAIGAAMHAFLSLFKN
ncbi:putative NBD/HSP70 family sugar kinase [Evansella vedderi]|uniref:NBD/HSP70 family sugar kinase n=1 Tax=Evansella vedderi TaxID=38282 RepID=A0ABT9ZNN4_9BACI|nr:ROK family protein [Evansella vedderi]MDQ0252854.1 putative NBD/HSP70 family sugar kinase [Evansella vedderi]